MELRPDGPGTQKLTEIGLWCQMTSGEGAHTEDSETHRTRKDPIRGGSVPAGTVLRVPQPLLVRFSEGSLL